MVVATKMMRWPCFQQRFLYGLTVFLCFSHALLQDGAADGKSLDELGTDRFMRNSHHNRHQWVDIDEDSMTPFSRGLIQQQQQQDASSLPNYYDSLRVAEEGLVTKVETANWEETPGEDVSDSNVFKVTDVLNQTYRLAHLTTFLPFSNGTYIRSSVHDDAAAVLLAIHHFNHRDTSPILNQEVNPHLSQTVQNCNARLTTELFDSRLDPVFATATITEILERKRSIERIHIPQPAGVIGAYRSAVTSPLTILSGVANIAQFSASSTSTDFDDTEVYPLYARTCPSSVGDAQVAVDYFRHLQVTHVAVLFVTDSFGSATQKAFEDYARRSKITTASVAFPYSHLDEIPNAVDALSRTEYGYIFVICYEDQYVPIMENAHKKGMTNGGHSWLFFGPDMDTFQRNAVYQPNSALYNATRGIGVLALDATPSKHVRDPLHPVLRDIPEDSDDSYDKVRLAWREAMADRTLTEYFHSKMPPELQGLGGYDPQAPFDDEPTIRGLFLYDVVTAMGIAMCDAAQEFFVGEDLVLQPFANTTAFDGATGKVQFESRGSRDPSTAVYTIWNVLPAEELDDDGNARFLLAPTNNYIDREWVDVEERDFLYSDGTKTPPGILPPVDHDEHKLTDASIAVGFAMAGTMMFTSLLCLMWTFLYRTEPVVCASQAPFLYVIAIGAFIQAWTIVFLSLQEPVSQGVLDFACMSSSWALGIGLSLTFGPLYAKTWCLYQVSRDPTIDRILLTGKDLLRWCCGMLLLNVVILSLWTIFAPNTYNRIVEASTDEFSRSVSSYASCLRDDNKDDPFRVFLLFVNSAALILANWWNLSARELETEYQENTYIGFALGFGAETLLVGFPIYFVIDSSPNARHYVMVAVVALLSLAVLVLVFAPKVRAFRQDRLRSKNRTMESESEIDTPWTAAAAAVTASSLDSAGMRPNDRNRGSMENTSEVDAVGDPKPSEDQEPEGGGVRVMSRSEEERNSATHGWAMSRERNYFKASASSASGGRR